ncbi:MAG TPA: DUF72 domain-containing protein [Baekduia sp.]|nr:DUF72 domain-containing protein [Baekduia sp.]
MAPVHVGCSGWIYRSWAGGEFYPDRCPQRLWLEHYATVFDTVEINNTFYRLPSRDAVAAWVERTPEDFVFTVKSSRFLTHMKRLTDMDQGVHRLWERLEPLARSPKMGPVLWQLPESFRRDDERLAFALDRLPPGRHVFEFRHPSWFAPEVLALLRDHGVALCIAHHPERPWQALELTADFTVVRFHYGARGRRGNYSERELQEWAERVAAWQRDAEVFAYFNNDWEGFAPRNAVRLRTLLEAAGVPTRQRAMVRSAV